MTNGTPGTRDLPRRVLGPVQEFMRLEVAGGTLLGRVVSPYTFETLEEIRAPYDRGVMILLRGAMMRVQPGDYGYMVANLATARPA